jgi:hypothetical protein
MRGMRRRELSERIERHMERGEELMELNRAAAERNTLAFERVMAALDRHEQILDRHEQLFDRHERLFEESREEREDLKTFIREMTRRNEKVIQDLLDGTQRVWAELKADLKEGREEARAQTQALLALIDRFPPPAQAA